MKYPAFLLACLVASCASIRAEADYDPNTDFERFGSFALLDPPERAPESLPWYSRLRGQEINRLLAAGLAERGLTRVPAAEADVRFSFQLIGEPRRELRYTGGGPYHYGPYYYGYYYGYYYYGHHGPTWYGPPGYWNQVYDVPYVVGTLAVDASERATGELIWHAWSSARFDGDDAKRNCERMVEAIVERWPGD